MQETPTIDKLISEVFSIGRETGSVGELFKKFGTRLKEILRIDDVIISDVYNENSELSGLEGFAINTNKPYIDNRLSGYSAFPELIKHYNLGFRSCMLLPVTVEGKAVFVTTLLSKEEDKFDNSLASTIGLALDILAYQAVAKIEKERSISLARYFDAAFNTNTPQLLVDKGGAIVKANKSVSGIFEKTQREIVGKNISEFFNVDANKLYSLRNGTSAEIKDNTEESRVYKVACSKISEKLTYALLYDVTEVKELEEKVRLSERSASDAFLLLAKDTTVLWASANINKTLKMGSEELSGKRLIDLAYTEKEFANQIGSITDTYSKPLKINVGNGVSVEVRVTLIKNQFGGFSCVMSSNNAEKYIASMQDAFSGLVDAASDAVLNIDALGYIKSVNKSTEKLLGYNNAELSGSALSSLYADQDSLQSFNSSLVLAKSNGVVGNAYVKMQVRGKELSVPCEQTIRSVIDQDNNLVGYMVIVKELASKMRMDDLEDEAGELSKELRDTKAESNLKSEFIYNISHDLKTPLTNIKGFGKLLLEGSENLSQEQKEYIGIITNESDRLYQLIQQILDVAKLSSGKIKLDLQRVNLNELAKNPTIGTLVEVAQNKGLEMPPWSVDYNVPEIQADPNRLIQVFVNLIGNAIKFTEKGSVKVRIFKKGKSVRIEVSDTGIGISKEDRSKLFKKFYQLRHGLTVQEGAGTGLGLAIVKEIVSLHKGRIGFISEPGKGSTFWFTLQIPGKVKKPSTAKEHRSEES